jgi:addiction module HigA family antidote
MNITAYRLSKDTKIPATRVAAILQGKRKITVGTAMRFARYFGNSVQFWLNLQNNYEIRLMQDLLEPELNQIQPLKNVS